MKVLLIGTSATEPDFVAWQAALQREGVKFDTVVGATHTPITATTLSGTLPDGITREGKYQAIIVAVGGDVDCSTGMCVSDLSAAELAAIESYEQAFEVRQITGDAFPSATYGLNAPTTTGALDGVQGSLTPDGQKVFPSLKGPVPMDTGTFGYQATPLTTTNFDTLVSGPAGSSLVGIYTHTDGVQEIVQTFNQNQNQLQSELLRHGAIAWATRGVYFGDQRNYLDTNIDDNFLGDDSWDTVLHTTNFDPAAALRETPSDVVNAATWSAQQNFRIDQLFNGGGSVAAAGTGTDPLLTAFKATNPATNKPYASSFGWINHTWDHPNLDQGCATQNYIEAEIQQNTAWALSASGLNLAPTSDPTVSLGVENPGVLVTGEHSGLANLLPGNPGIIDPPSFDSVPASSTGGTLPAGTYTYAISDQFAAAGGESTASQSDVTVPANSSVTLSWGAVCHAADYKIYRAVTGSNVWTLLTTIPADTTNPPNTAFDDPASTTDVTGGGPLSQSYIDTGGPGTPSAGLAAVNGATETAYQQNQSLDAAFAAAGIKTFGSDSSKPYPSPANATFANGSAPSTQYANGATFTLPVSGAQAEARYPTNIYYNVSTEAQEVDEYNHLYLPASLGGACVNSSTTTCAATPATFADIIKTIDQGMLQHILGNDPRPDYFHQTNMMGTPPPGAPTTGTPPATSPSIGDGLYYSTMNELLASYATYYNVPVQQLTGTQIAQLLAQQAAWAGNTTVTGYIQGNQVTITNGATSTQIPLTGIATVGSTYGGTQSGWTSAAAGTTTYTAMSTWPAPGVSQSPQGTWFSQLGSSGYLLAGWDGTQDVSNLPNITPTLQTGTRTQWARNTTDVRALQAPDGSQVRNATAFTDPTKVSVGLKFANAYAGDISIYALDWNKQGRTESISLDDGSGPPRMYSLATDFSAGQWLTFPVTVAAGATVTISATNTATATATTTPTAVISGIMIGDAGAPPATTGTQAPQGDWSGSYGSAGYDLAAWNATGDVSWMPNATVSLVQGIRAVQAAKTTSPRALSDPGNTYSTAASYIDPNQVQVQLSFTHAYTGNLNLYGVDWDSTARRQLMTVDGQTAQLGSDFSQGGWVSFPIAVAIGGTVTITVDRTAGASAVLSGIFLGGKLGSPPTAQISAPNDHQTYDQSQSVTTHFSCSDAAGDGISSCTDARSAGSTGSLDTSTTGAHKYTVTATSNDGQTATATIDYTVSAPAKPTTPPVTQPVAPPVTAPAPLRLHTVHAPAGYTGVVVTGPAGATVKLSEEISHKLVSIGVVRLTGGTAARSRALTWGCTPLHRTVVASTLSPAAPQRAAITVTTPSCSKRLATTIASRSGVRRAIAITLHDLWGAGRLRVRICLTGPGTATGCRQLSLRTGQQRKLRLIVRTGGRWKVSVSTQYGAKVTVMAWVI